MHELEFGPNKFTGAFPAEMVQLTSLVSFIVSKNALTGTLPSNFNKLQKLEVFAASSNQLSSTLPESFASLPKLQELDLSSNYLTGVVHRELVPNVAARPGWYESGFLYALGLPLSRLLCRVIKPQLCPANTFRTQDSQANLGQCEYSPVTSHTAHAHSSRHR